MSANLTGKTVTAFGKKFKVLSGPYYSGKRDAQMLLVCSSEGCDTGKIGEWRANQFTLTDTP
jgi:hypothetical protein